VSWCLGGEILILFILKFAKETGMELVSACLVGVKCRYDGHSRPCRALVERLAAGELVPVCPEQLGGLPTPRTRAQIERGSGWDVLAGRARVVDECGHDVTRHFVRGARETLKLARRLKAAGCLLKQNSPSCGCGAITRNGRRVRGLGVTAALLRRAGVAITAIP
jgi:uncharacterized protein YbbK (DUF523 family)